MTKYNYLKCAKVHNIQLKQEKQSQKNLLSLTIVQVGIMLLTLDKVYHLDLILLKHALSSCQLSIIKKMINLSIKIIIAFGAKLMTKNFSRDYTNQVSLAHIYK